MRKRPETQEAPISNVEKYTIAESLEGRKASQAYLEDPRHESESNARRIMDQHFTKAITAERARTERLVEAARRAGQAMQACLPSQNWNSADDRIEYYAAQTVLNEALEAQEQST